MTTIETGPLLVGGGDPFYSEVNAFDDTDWFRAHPDRNFRAVVWFGTDEIHGRVLVDDIPLPVQEGNWPTSIPADAIPEGVTPRVLGFSIVRRIDIHILKHDEKSTMVDYDFSSYEKLKPGSAAMRPQNVVGIHGKRASLHPITIGFRADTPHDEAMASMIHLIDRSADDAALYAMWMDAEKLARKHQRRKAKKAAVT
jgi:hypothetical protein